MIYDDQERVSVRTVLSRLAASRGFWLFIFRHTNDAAAVD